MIKFLIDSASDITEAEAKDLGVTMLPMIIGFGEEEYYDGVDLLPCEFYEKLAASKEMPKTAQITPFRFEDAFERLTQDGSEVIAIVISSRLSGTYNAAVQAAKSYHGKVHVVDSYTACAGERLLLELAIMRRAEGKSAAEIVNELNEKKHTVFIAAVIETLEYLKRGGRISGATAFFGGILNIKPIVKIVDGRVESVGKAHGKKKGLLSLTELALSLGGIDESLPYGVIYTGTDESPAQKYAMENSALFPKSAPCRTFVIGSTIGTHVGPGAVGCAFFAKAKS